MLKRAVLIVILTAPIVCYPQRAKDASFTAVSSSGTIVNAYTVLTSDAPAGSSSLQVSNNTLNSGSVFSSNLAAGDLIFIIQMKGVSLNGIPVDIGGGDTLGYPNDATLGAITSYGNCGNHEFAEVTGVSGLNTINLRCNLQYDYTASGAVQVIRVPRFADLTVNAGASVTAPAWNGVTGGAVILEVTGDLVLNGDIDVTGVGFRGGVVDNVSITFAGQHAGTNPLQGARKGEGIAGYNNSYGVWGGAYGRGAFANAGGGGTAHNAGGGGGANAASIPWLDGLGNPDVSGGAGWVSAWNLEGTATPNAMTATTTSGGGGRGGYTWADQNQNATTVGPGNAAWAGDNRRVQGGLGGRPLDYTLGKIFFGGGGGAGEMNDNEGGNGGNAGGLVYGIVYGDVTGSGNILANGQDGFPADGPTPTFGISGGDGAGGGGAGGTVILEASGNISVIGISADGGAGGDQMLQVGAFASAETQGPGGGGGGGYIATTASSSTYTVAGGVNGTTNSPDLTEFPPNGATGGASGISLSSLTTYGFTVEADTICGGGSATLTAVTYGTVPGGTTLNWYSDPGITNVGTGTTFNTPALTTTTTYYVGFCSGADLTAVTISVSPNIIIDVSGISVINENCGNSNGSITGISVSGGVSPLAFDWNGSASLSPDTLGLAGGAYTLTVTDANGCSETSGPHSVLNDPGPSIDITSVNLIDETCGNVDGAITGIIVTGTGNLTYDWNGNLSSSADTVNIAAGSYTLTVTDTAGCVSTSGPFTINNLGAPVIDQTGLTLTDEICSGTNGAITGMTVSGGTSPYTFGWNGNTATAADTTGISAGTYTLTVTDAFGCTAVAGPFTISDQAAPVIDASAAVITDENCGQFDGSITGISVTGNPILSYSWNGTPAVSADLNGAGAGSYTLIVVDGNGCSDTTGPFSIATYSGPVIDDTNILIVDENCVGNNGSISGIVASGQGPLQFDWNGNTTLTADTSGLLAGSYSITVTDSVGCFTTSGPYVVNTIPPLTLDASNSVVNDENCGLSDGSITGILITGGAGTLIYDWNGSPSTGPDLTGISAGSYTLTVTDSLGCVVTSSPFTINGTPPLNVTVSGTSTICEGQTATLTASGATSYNWTPGGASPSITVAPVSTTVYQVVGTSGPCLDTVLYTIVVNPLPSVAISGDTVICMGESTMLSASGGSTYTWNTADVSATISVSPATTTIYSVFSGNSCGNDTAQVQVIVNPLPAADAGPDQTILLGNGTTLSGSGGSTYLWSPAMGLDCNTCSDPYASPLQTTTYVLTVTDANGCSRSDTVLVVVDEQLVLYIPNIFSPNGDGQNDVLAVRGGGIADIEFRVYDRWGEQVFMSRDLKTGWDGVYRGSPAVAGVYAYTLSGHYLDGSTINETGNITLVR